VECKLRCINFRRVSDPRRALWLAFSITGISDDLYRNTIRVILINWGTPHSAGENFWSTLGPLGAPVTSHGAPMTRLGLMTTNLGVPTTNLGLPTTNQGVPTTNLGVPTSHLGVPRTNLGVPTTRLGAPATCL